MRLHELEVTAFGPFADTISVDFDDLSDAGLFLLTGPTGAGKTSILDAVCFGLYGEVPGDRASAKHLRCDQAGPGVAPRIVLRLSIGARTFRFTRSPAWTRPKKRGQGTTRVQAHVVVEEHSAGEWRFLTNRLDDAGLLVSDLLGMTCSQFTQVAMLPQGRFQAFLRASSTERHAVLQKLFRTTRFEDVERWLVDRRSELRREGQTAQERTAGIVNRLQEAGGVGLPAEWDVHDLALPTSSGEVATWATALVDDARTTAAAAEAALASTAAALQQATAARDEGALVHDAHRRATDAHTVLTEHAARAAELTTLKDRVTAHHRAAPIAGIAVRAERSLAAVTDAANEMQARTTLASEILGTAEVTEPELATAQQFANEARAVAEAFRPREAELSLARDRAQGHAARIDELATSIAALDERADALPAEIARLKAELKAAVQVANTLVAAEHLVETTSAALAAARRVVDITAELTSARETLRASVDRAQDLRERYHDVREARISGMAAELATGLVVGCSCPVCGSAEHPAPAAVSGGAVGRAEEDAARHDYEAADFTRQTQQEDVTNLETNLAVARAGSRDTSPPVLADQLAEQQVAVGRARRAASQTEHLGDRLNETHLAQSKVASALAEARSEVAAADALLAQTRTTIGSLSTERATLLIDSRGAADIEGLIAEHQVRARIFEDARTALRVHQIAARAAEEAAAMASAAAVDAGFADVTAAQVALLSDDSLSGATSAIVAADEAARAASATLADPAVSRRLAVDAPDPALLDAAHAVAARERDDAGSAYDQERKRVSRLAVLRDTLTRELLAWAPVREQYAVAAGLSAFVEGKGPDNPQRMRLSAYVLSERLRQVVDAANERLARMSDQRYSLEHTDDRGAGELRGGLSLLIRDDWNGTRRDPATLSGGETFVVSLALALGLADTVSHEAGGTDIDTLFIDEGFGSLDTETLEDVMDTLDSLRDGGRVVGIVSHVAELRTRITAQLEVSKSRSGSTIRAAVSVG